MDNRADSVNSSNTRQEARKQVGSTVAFTFGSSMVTIFVNLLFTPLLIRLISQKEYGQYAFAVSLITFLSTVFVFGLNDALKKFGALFGLRDETRDSFLTAFLGMVILFSVFALGLVGAGLLLANRLEWIPVFSRSLLLLIAAIIALQVSFELIRSCLYGMHLQQISEPLDVLLKIGWKSGAILVLWMGSQLEGLFEVWLFTLLATSLIGLTLLFRHAQPTGLHGMADSLSSFLPGMLRHGGWVFVGAMCMQVLYQADILMIGTMLDHHATALYKPALVAVHFLWIIPQVVNRSFLPSFSEHWNKKDPSVIRNILAKGVKFTFHSLLLLGGGLFVLSRSFTEVYFGARYLESALPIKILVTGTAALGLARLTGAVFQASGHVRVEAACIAAAAASNIILNALLIPFYGILGAAAATSLTYALLLAMKNWGLKVSTGLNLLEGFPAWKFLVLGLSWPIVLYGFHALLPQGSLTSLLLASSFGLISYLIGSRVLGLLDNREIRAFAELIRGSSGP